MPKNVGLGIGREREAKGGVPKGVLSSPLIKAQVFTAPPLFYDDCYEALWCRRHALPLHSLPSHALLSRPVPSRLVAVFFFSLLQVTKSNWKGHMTALVLPQRKFIFMGKEIMEIPVIEGKIVP